MRGRNPPRPSQPRGSLQRRRSNCWHAPPTSTRPAASERALAAVAEATAHAQQAERRDLLVRALAIEGTVTAKLGRLDDGLASARAALALALADDEPELAIDAYQHLANVLENATDLDAAEDVYRTAYGYCEARGERAASQVCLICIAFILFQTGKWDECAALDQEIFASPDAPFGARLATRQHLAFIAALRGHTRRARRLSTSPPATASATSASAGSSGNCSRPRGWTT